MMMAEATIPSTLPEGVPDIGSNPPQDPIAKAIALVPEQLDQLAQQGKGTMIQIYTNGYNAAWNRAAGLTPRQFFAAAGTKGAAFLIRGGALREFLNAQYKDLNLPGIPDIYNVTVNADGTVTVTEK
jgi:hypothetical protein